MNDIKVGDRLEIHCYKHNGKLHRQWDEAVVLEIKDDYIVFGNNKTQVTEAEGNIWRTKEPAIMYFFKDKWFNVIAQLKKDGIYYYCNIASPFIIEEDTIKYIDYDLDLRVFPSGDYKILDKGEYKYHKRIMNYSDDLDWVINNAMKELLSFYNNHHIVFDENMNYHYYDEYNVVKTD